MNDLTVSNLKAKVFDIIKVYEESEIAEKIRKLVGDDLNKDPTLALGAILDISDEIIYSLGLRRAICNDFESLAGEKFRMLLLYIAVMVVKPTKEELVMVTNQFEEDKESYSQEDEEDEE